MMPTSRQPTATAAALARLALLKRLSML